MSELWTPFQEAEEVQPPATPDDIRHQRAKWKVSGQLKTWVNSLYTVTEYGAKLTREQGMVTGSWPDMIWLSIRTADRRPVHDWRHLQRIKNELVGPEHEAVEVFPAESRLVDSANQYHLFVLAERGLKFPFGYLQRDVCGSDEAARSGAVQREVR